MLTLLEGGSQVDAGPLQGIADAGSLQAGGSGQRQAALQVVGDIGRCRLRGLRPGDPGPDGLRRGDEMIQ